MKQCLNGSQCVAKINEFFYGYSFPLIMALIAVVSYIFDIALVGFTVFAICACLTLIINRDILPLITLAGLFLFCFPTEADYINVYFYVMCGLVGACIIAHFIIYPVKKFFLGKLFIPFCLISFALFLGGIGSPYIYDWPNAIASMISNGPVLLFIYLFFSNYLTAPKKVDIKRYFCFLLLLICFTALATLFFTQGKSYILNDKSITFNKSWCNINVLAILILLAAPACCYLLARARFQLPYFIIIVLLLPCMYLTNSMGCLGILAVCLPFMVIMTYLTSERKRQFLIFCSIIIALACLAMIVLLIKIDIMSKLDTSDSGRSKLYTLAIKAFKESPVFGVGMGYINLHGYNPAYTHTRQFNFHSIVLHVLASMGVFGCGCYAYYYFKRFAILMGNKSGFNACMTCAFLMFATYQLIDMSEFALFPQMFLITTMLVITEMTNNDFDYARALRHEFRLKPRFAPIT